jgi:hypothetical protein
MPQVLRQLTHNRKSRPAKPKGVESRTSSCGRQALVSASATAVPDPATPERLTKQYEAQLRIAIAS